MDFFRGGEKWRTTSIQTKNLRPFPMSLAQARFSKTDRGAKFRGCHVQANSQGGLTTPLVYSTHFTVKKGRGHVKSNRPRGQLQRGSQMQQTGRGPTPQGGPTKGGRGRSSQQREEKKLSRGDDVKISKKWVFIYSRP